MAFTLHERMESDVAVLTPDGRMDSASLQEFSAQIQTLVDAGTTKVLIDFSKTEYMSSAGVRSIIDGLKKVESKGGTMAVCSPNVHLTELFDVIQLGQVLTIYPSEFEALDKMI